MTEEFRINITAQDKTKAAIASAERSLEGFRASALNVSGALSGIAGALTVREIASMADSYQNIQARLKLATKDAEEFAAANENIKRIALSSQNPLESTATLYTRISQSLLDVGGTQQQVANTTQALALALRLSGATAGESASAMLQFSQAIGSGVLRGEEFNAVNEAAPRAMKALADALGVPIGNLRKMAEQGEITRDILVEALGSQLPKLIAEAETLPNTFGATFTSLRNQLLLMIGELDQYSGASGATAKAVGEAGRIALETIVVLGANVGFVFKGIYTEITGIGSQLVALSKLDFTGFTSIGDRMKKEAAAARKELDEFEQRILNPKKPKDETPSTDKGAADRLQALLAEAQAEAKAAAAAKAAEAAAKASANANKSALQTMQDRLFASQKLSEVERTNLDISIGRYKDLTAASKARLLDLASQIDANEKLAEAQKAQEAIDAKNSEDGIARFKALQEAGAAVYASTRTDAQKYSDEVIRLNDLLAQGAITQDTYNQAVLNAQDAYQKASDKAKQTGQEMSQYAIQAARNQQTAFAQFLFDPFQDGLDGMAAGFLNAIRQMAANAAAAHIFDALFGKGSDSGLLGSLFNSAIGAFTGTKKFASGGDFGGGLRLVGEQGPELEVTGPSRIFSAQQTKAMLGGGGDVHVYQTFNVQTGTSQTVRAEMFSLLPAFKKQAIEAVIDAKKRGGRLGASLS